MKDELKRCMAHTRERDLQNEYSSCNTGEAICLPEDFPRDTVFYKGVSYNSMCLSCVRWCGNTHSKKSCTADSYACEFKYR